MSKITYIFGAGASRNALPIVKDIPDRLKSLINLLESEKLQLSTEEKFKDTGLENLQSKNFYQKKLIKDLQWLLDYESKHSSVDTFARKLSIIGDHQNLKKLKVVLSVFFTFEQIIKQPDKRYDSFFASLYNEVNELPKNGTDICKTPMEHIVGDIHNTKYVGQKGKEKKNFLFMHDQDKQVPDEGNIISNWTKKDQVDPIILNPLPRKPLTEKNTKRAR